MRDLSLGAKLAPIQPEVTGETPGASQKMRFNPKSLGWEGAATPATRGWKLAIVGLVGVVALLGATAVRPVWTIDPDASLYLGLGRSLAAGDGDVLDGQPHTK